jgi:hypothetical protein
MLNKNLLPVVKQLANDSMLNNAMMLKRLVEITKVNVQFPFMELGKDEAMCRTMVLFLPSH